MSINWGELLQSCRERLGPEPRQFDREQQQYFGIRPFFLVRFFMLLRGDKLRGILRDLHLLRDHGRVVWGHLVQANQLLFSPANGQTLPANILYSPDLYFDDRVPLLQEIAQRLFQLKGTSPEDQELEQFAQAITDELARTMRLPLPRSLSEGRDIFLTTCFIEPAHLPGGYLNRGFFPLMICPEKTEAVMVLPARYWPKELRAFWTQKD